jgi:hypothetical protein
LLFFLCHEKEIKEEKNKLKRQNIFGEVAPRSYETKDRNVANSQFHVFIVNFPTKFKSVHKTSPEV